MVIELYQLPLVADIDDVYGMTAIPQELAIKTHYEGLDIAGSNRIHYLCFRLPATTLPFETDTILKEKVFEIEKV
jgi:tRNA (guanine-N7-)-methyltransferase